MTEWFRRLAEVPDVGYKGRSDIDRSHLPDSNAVPEIRFNNFERERHESLWWPTRDGSTTASPVQHWKTQPRKDETPMQQTLRQMHEALELPGELSHYHFAIMNCFEELWKNRREEPWVLPEIERLCWLDIHLIQTYPHMLDEGSYTPPAFGRLIFLYEREGYLYEALEVAKVAVSCNLQESALERLQARIAQLESEDAG